MEQKNKTYEKVMQKIGNNGSGINPTLSVYFNFLRVSAALVVLSDHYAPVLFGIRKDLVPGHDAVVVFFVLSGYVIAYVSDQRERSLRDYALSRLSRLWSVAVPAAALALLAWIVVGPVTVAGFAYAAANLHDLARRALLNLGFLGEGWGGEVFSPYNTPVWSLNCEAWYYAIFGSWVFLRGRAQLLVAAGLCVLAGPIVLALMPCWLIGVLLYRFRRRLTMRPALAYLLFAATLLAYGAAYKLDLITASRLWLKSLTFGEAYHLGTSTSCLGDLMLALLVAANFIAAANMPSLGRALGRFRREIGVAASYTLSVYLYHTPLFAIVFGSVDGAGAGTGAGMGRTALVLLVIACAIVALGRITEHRQRAWRAGLARVLDFIRPRTRTAG